jgi:hypothetical protein
MSEKQPHFNSGAVEKAFATYASPIPLTDLRDPEVQGLLAKEAVLLSTPEGTALLKKETHRAEVALEPSALRRFGRMVYTGASYGLMGSLYAASVAIPGTVAAGAMAYTGLWAGDIAITLASGDIKQAVAGSVITAFSGAISYKTGRLTYDNAVDGIETMKQIHEGRDVLGFRDKNK